MTVFEDLERLENRHQKIYEAYQESLNAFFKSNWALESEVSKAREEMQEAKENNASNYDELLKQFLSKKNEAYIVNKAHREELKKIQTIGINAETKIANLQKKIKEYATFGNVLELIDAIAILMSLVENKNFSCYVEMFDFHTKGQKVRNLYYISIFQKDEIEYKPVILLIADDSLAKEPKINFYGPKDNKNSFGWKYKVEGYEYVKDFIDMMIIDRNNKDIKEELSDSYYMDMLQKFIVKNHEAINQKRAQSLASKEEEEPKPPVLH